MTEDRKVHQTFASRDEYLAHAKEQRRIRKDRLIGTAMLKQRLGGDAQLPPKPTNRTAVVWKGQNDYGIGNSNILRSQ